MCQFFETIDCRDGYFALLDYHEARMNRTRFELFGCKESIDLRKVLANYKGPAGWQRCRVVYANEVDTVEFMSYGMAIHSSVSLLEAEGFAYKYKAVNRDFINEAVRVSGCDDVLFLRNGWLTDASYANICLYQYGEWFTPENCLLPGVKRQFLLDKQQIKTRSIHVQDLSHYTAIAFINAMRDFEMVYEFELLGDKIILKNTSA